jgi:prevent-host-death family protein
LEDIVAWQLQAAKQRFSELVERARSEGPQVVTKHGREAVVVVSAEEYRSLSSARADDFVEFLRSGPDLDLLDLGRARDRGREPTL